jgi:signal transduction histidine kinase
MPKKKTTQDLQSDFITLTSHQLRTPLSGMKWLLELLQKDNTGNLNKKQREFLEKIYNSNERMIALVNDLLEVSRLESGQSKLYLQPTDLASVVRILVKEKEKEIKQKKLNVTLTVEQEPFPLVKTEPIKIKQAIGNIFTNAVIFTPGKRPDHHRPQG